MEDQKSTYLYFDSGLSCTFLKEFHYFFRRVKFIYRVWMNYFDTSLREPLVYWVGKYIFSYNGKFFHYLGETIVFEEGFFQNI